MNKILRETEVLVKEEKKLTLKILKNLEEIDRLKLYSDLGYSSLFCYMIKCLGYTEKETSLRISSMRFLTKNPTLETSMQKGALNLTQLSMLGAHQKVNPEQKISAVAKEIEGKSTRASAIILDDLSAKKTNQEEMKQIKVSVKTYKLLEKLRGQEESDDALISALLEEKLAKKRLAKKPRKIAAGKGPSSPRYIPQRVKDKVFIRDQFRCLSCGSRGRLEVDHIHPFALGGSSELTNLQTLCQSCNLKKSIVDYGEKKMDQYLSRR